MNDNFAPLSVNFRVTGVNFERMRVNFGNHIKSDPLGRFRRIAFFTAKGGITVERYLYPVKRYLYPAQRYLYFPKRYLYPAKRYLFSFRATDH
ncbi:hypothetical protein [Bhargavaea cecembensis]|uniref:hypothetical protein n=1 Tax=Bhargavaea cecembensis TaxID=394098 RepID=UPI00117775DA|nr:hypothetical protein [Bhargavaea cecembensis]